MLQRLRMLGAVAAGDVDALSVGRERKRMIAVFALRLDLAEQRLLVELPVALRVAQPIQPRCVRLLIHHHIQTVEGVQQPVRALNVRGELLHLRGSLLPSGGGVRRYSPPY